MHVSVYIRGAGGHLSVAPFIFRDSGPFARGETRRGRRWQPAVGRAGAAARRIRGLYHCWHRPCAEPLRVTSSGCSPCVPQPAAAAPGASAALAALTGPRVPLLAPPSRLVAFRRHRVPPRPAAPAPPARTRPAPARAPPTPSAPRSARAPAPPPLRPPASSLFPSSSVPPPRCSRHRFHCSRPRSPPPRRPARPAAPSAAAPRLRRTPSRAASCPRPRARGRGLVIRAPGPRRTRHARWCAVHPPSRPPRRRRWWGEWRRWWGRWRWKGAGGARARACRGTRRRTRRCAPTRSVSRGRMGMHRGGGGVELLNREREEGRRVPAQEAHLGAAGQGWEVREEGEVRGHRRGGHGARREPKGSKEPLWSFELGWRSGRRACGGGLAGHAGARRRRARVRTGACGCRAGDRRERHVMLRWSGGAKPESDSGGGLRHLPWAFPDLERPAAASSFPDPFDHYLECAAHLLESLVRVFLLRVVVSHLFPPFAPPPQRPPTLDSPVRQPDIRPPPFSAFSHSSRLL